jgi:hypothetical protein
MHAGQTEHPGRRSWPGGTAAGLVVVPADRGNPVRNMRGPRWKADRSLVTTTDGTPGSLRCGPAEHYQDTGTCRAPVRLAREPPRPVLRMMPPADHCSSPPPRPVPVLIPCRHVRPSAAYFRVGHLLLDQQLARRAAVHRRQEIGPREHGFATQSATHFDLVPTSERPLRLPFENESDRR